MEYNKKVNIYKHFLQNGDGMPIFRGDPIRHRQRGAGLGALLSGMFRNIIPFLKKGISTVTPMLKKAIPIIKKTSSPLLKKAIPLIKKEAIPLIKKEGGKFLTDQIVKKTEKLINKITSKIDKNKQIGSGKRKQRKIVNNKKQRKKAKTKQKQKVIKKSKKQMKTNQIKNKNKRKMNDIITPSITYKRRKLNKKNIYDNIF